MNQLDTLWRACVKLLNYGCSIYTKSPSVPIIQHLHAHHIITRSNKAVRWDVDNGIPVTAVEHRAIHDGILTVECNEELQKRACAVGDTSVNALREKSKVLQKTLAQLGERFDEYWKNH